MESTSIGRDSRSAGERGGGPGWIVAAAFIGPGTVTTATLAGAGFGPALLWALLFSVAATMILQEMSARLGLVTRMGLGEAVRRRFDRPALRVAAVGLVIGAIAIGNAAYETGNLLGGALGLEGAVGGRVELWALAIGAAAFGLLWHGRYGSVERVMIGLVALMSIAFLATAARVLPRVDGLFGGLFLPTLPDGSLLVAVGLIGTTIAPYNLFLHATAVQEKWRGPGQLGIARKDLVVSIGLGGIVSMAILVTSAGTIFVEGGATVENAAGMAVQLEPLLGPWARLFFGAGLFAAGMTSAVTAPLAAAWATAGALGWDHDLRDTRVRAVWIAVLATGVVLSLVGFSPVGAILFAQIMNGVLLPAVALFLLLAVNHRRWMGHHGNGALANLMGGLVVLIAAVLGFRALLGAFRTISGG